MRALFVALVCSGAILGQSAFAQTNSPAAPSASAQPVAPAATTTAAPPQAATAAATPPASETVVVNGERVGLDQVVCKNQPPTTGTRLGGSRECLTVREWNQQRREAQDITTKSQIQGYNSFAAGH